MTIDRLERLVLGRGLITVIILGFILWQLYQIKDNTRNIGQAYACPAYGTDVEL